jgi:hypothetical protein
MVLRLVHGESPVRQVVAVLVRRVPYELAVASRGELEPLLAAA